MLTEKRGRNARLQNCIPLPMLVTYPLVKGYKVWRDSRMLDAMTLETFTSLSDRVFELVQPDGVTRSLELIEAAALSDRPNPGTGRLPLSLIFQAPPDLQLPQRMYPLRHPELAEQEFFLVPIQPNAQGPLYEAVFN
jgi:hypothetical protein